MSKHGRTGWIRCCLLIIVLASVLDVLDGGRPVAAAPTLLSFTPTDDSYADPRLPNSVFGGFTFLNYTVTSTSQSYLFMKFDISNLPPPSYILNATLKLSLLGNSSSLPGYQPMGDIQVGVFNASNSWSENTLTFASAPISSISPVPSDVIAVASPGSYMWNITSLLLPAVGQSRVTIVVHHDGALPPSPNMSLLLFRSKESGVPSLIPTLTVTYQKDASPALTTQVLPSETIFGSPVIINSTLTPARQTGLLSIQFSLDNQTWSTIDAEVPDINGGVVTIWFPPIATTYFIRSLWGGDFLTQDSISTVQTLRVAKNSSSTAISLGTSSMGFGNQTLIIATVQPQLSDGIMRVEFSVDGGSTWTERFSRAPVNGIAFQPFIPESVGTYFFRALYSGNTNYNASISPTRSIVVTKAPTTISLSVSSSIIAVGSSARVSGFLRVAGGSAINGATVTLQYRRTPDTSITNVATQTTDLGGSFDFPWIPPSNGTYKVSVHFGGTGNYAGAVSREQEVLVVFEVFPSPGAIGLITGIIGFFIGLGLSFLVRFRRSVAVKRRQKYGGAKTKGE